MGRQYGRVVVLGAPLAEDRNVDGEEYGGVPGVFSPQHQSTSGIVVSTDVQLKESNRYRSASFGHFFHGRRWQRAQHEGCVCRRSRFNINHTQQCSTIRLYAVIWGSAKKVSLQLLSISLTYWPIFKILSPAHYRKICNNAVIVRPITP